MFAFLFISGLCLSLSAWHPVPLPRSLREATLGEIRAILLGGVAAGYWRTLTLKGGRLGEESKGDVSAAK